MNMLVQHIPNVPNDEKLLVYKSIWLFTKMKFVKALIVDSRLSMQLLKILIFILSDKVMHFLRSLLFFGREKQLIVLLLSVQTVSHGFSCLLK